MTLEGARPLCDRVLISVGITHGFGQKKTQVPENTDFPSQVHGVAVVEAPWHASTGEHARSAAGDAPEGDVVWTRQPGQSVGIVTADCVPLLVASQGTRAVGAIHAGWRGLAAGVVECGLEAILGGTGEHVRSLRVAIGPSARGCCYEVDEPVRDAMATRYADFLEEAFVPGRPGHFLFDPAIVVARSLARFGVEAAQIGMQNSVCTICDPARFESFRRDGGSAGRLRHFITASSPANGEG